MKEQHTSLSKFLSYVLRHRPDSIGVDMDDAGWVRIDELIQKSVNHPFTRDNLELIVQTDSKGRYSISEDGQRIRANQGHSITVDLNLKPSIPPVVLYHGTSDKALPSILKVGLQKMKRHHVHLSETKDTARTVGARHGKPVVLQVDVKEMVREGFVFFRSENGVWLTDTVPVKFLKGV